MPRGVAQLPLSVFTTNASLVKLLPKEDPATGSRSFYDYCRWLQRGSSDTVRSCLLAVVLPDPLSRMRTKGRVWDNPGNQLPALSAIRFPGARGCGSESEMEREVILRRNVAFNVFYRRVAFLYPRLVPLVMRWLVEVLFLLLAILTLCLWSYIHITYVVEPADCLTALKDRPFSSHVILQVEVYSNSSELYYLAKRYSLQHTGKKTKSTAEIFDNEGSTNSTEEDETKFDPKSSGVDDEGKLSLYEILDIYMLKLYSVDYTILEFSQEPGYLSLSNSARARLNITTRHLYIDPENATCFGGSFGHFITKYILGYEMMIISSFKNLLPATEGSGYVKNLLTGIHYYYRVQWMGKWRYIAGLLPSFFFTLVASVLLRQIHYHGFKFLTHFHHLLHEGIPMPIQTGAQVPFLIITYATIGLVIVMSEALGDDSVFCLLMVSTVWEADQFYAVFCRHKISKAYFPMFFFLYHSLPYAYFLRFNGQFWFLPFLFHWLLMQNAILFFFHHFELSGHNQVVENLIQPANFQQQNTNQPEQPLLEVQPLNEGEAVERTTTSPEQDEQSAEHRSPVEESRTLSAVFIPTLREDHMSAVELVNRRAGRSTDIHSIRERSLMHLDRH